MSILIDGLDMPEGQELLCIDIYPDGLVCIDMDLKCRRIATASQAPAGDKPGGSWVETNPRPRSMTFVCSLCGGLVYAPQNNRREKTCRYRFCPHCGRPMEVRNA